MWMVGTVCDNMCNDIPSDPLADGDDVFAEGF